MMWPWVPAMTSWPRWTCAIWATRLPIAPEETKSPPSLPSSSATRSSSARTVGSSPKTSSPTSACAIASRIAGVGRVTVSDRRSACTASVLVEHLGDEERQLEALLVVEPGVADRLVAQVEVGVEDLLRPADALGDVVARELDVDAAGHGAERAVHLEEPLDLLDDVVEVAGLVARGRLVGVAVHGVAHPRHRGPRGGDLLDDGRQRLTDVAGTHPRDEGQPAGLAIGVDLVDDAQEVVGVGVRRHLDPHGVADGGDEVDVGAVEIAGALPHPH